MHQSFLVHVPDDVVGVAVRDIEPGPGVPGRIQNGGGHITVDAVDHVPLGHKIAMRDIAAGEQIIKYGTAIGRATADIRAGEHVHVHNLKGERWA